MKPDPHGRRDCGDPPPPRRDRQIRDSALQNVPNLHTSLNRHLAWIVLQLNTADEAATFENSVPESVAANYRRLANDPSVVEVLSKLKRRGCSEPDVEILLRNLASIPDDWPRENEPWAQAYDIPSFCRAYSISRSFAYLEIKSGRLKPFKAGRRTLISRQAADDWRQGLEQDTNGIGEGGSPGTDQRP